MKKCNQPLEVVLRTLAASSTMCRTCQLRNGINYTDEQRPHCAAWRSVPMVVFDEGCQEYEPLDVDDIMRLSGGSCCAEEVDVCDAMELGVDRWFITMFWLCVALSALIWWLA